MSKMQHSESALATKNRIARIASELIREQGFDKVSVTAIARAAQVSIGTFYYYFPSKTDLMYNVRRIDAYFQKEMPQRLTHQDMCRDIQIFFSAYAEFSVGEGVKITHSLFHDFEGKMLIAENSYMFGLLMSILQEGVEQEQLRADTDLQAVTRRMFMSVQGVLWQWVISSGQIPLERELVTITHELLSGYLI